MKQLETNMKPDWINWNLKCLDMQILHSRAMRKGLKGTPFPLFPRTFALSLDTWVILDTYSTVYALSEIICYYCNIIQTCLYIIYRVTGIYIFYDSVQMMNTSSSPKFLCRSNCWLRWCISGSARCLGCCDWRATSDGGRQCVPAVNF